VLATETQEFLAGIAERDDRLVVADTETAQQLAAFCSRQPICL
jgi:hypothetical protein